MRNRLAAALLLTVASAFPAVAETHPFSIHDMLAMERISEPAVSPDGASIAFTLRTTDLDANRGRTDVWMVRADGTGLRRMTADPAGDSSPQWSPDSKTIYFLSSRSGSSQVWKIAAGGGEAHQVTSLPLDVGGFLISPDASRFALSMEVFPGTTPEETVTRVEAERKRASSGRIYDELLYRHWDTWLDGRRNHVFVVPVDGGDPIDVMKAMRVDTPSRPFGGTEEYAFTPDSKSVVFTARDAGREEAWSTNFDLWLAPADGSGAPVNLTDENDAWDTMPSFAPGGRRLAYLAMRRPGYESDQFDIIIREWPDGAARNLTARWDRSPSAIVWSSDAKTIYTVADNVGQQSLFAIDVASGAVRTIVEEGYVTSPAVADGRIVYGYDTLKSPVELFSVSPAGGDVRRITAINREELAAARMGDYEQFSFEGANGDTVHGYLVRPVDFDPSKEYPVAFLVHGGPQGSFGNHFHYRWNPQAYAGAGYAAVMIDFHGSVGYGLAFKDAIRGDWGGKPLEDLQKGLAFALDRYSFLDGDRIGALGASYGGYMINWMHGVWNEPFDAFVVHDGNLDERFAYFATEELWFPEWDHLGTPWENPEAYEKHNPILHVDEWRVPTLVIHGANDFRVVETEGMATFTALQRRGIPSRFLYFPDENHWVLKPANSIQWHETVIGWLDEWVK
ncbi:MAG: prolyl oligopeptidase family serine peptidase [Thermoanaerobaculia bacterium]